MWGSEGPRVGFEPQRALCLAGCQCPFRGSGEGPSCLLWLLGAPGDPWLWPYPPPLPLSSRGLSPIRFCVSVWLSPGDTSLWVRAHPNGLILT